TLGPLPFRRASFALGIGQFFKTYEQVAYARAAPKATTRRKYGAVITAGENVYFIGGGGPSKEASIDRATANADRTFAGFVPASVTLQTARSGHVAVAFGRRVYVIGGQDDGGNPLASVEAATLDANGTLSSFVLVPGVMLSHPRLGTMAAVVGNTLYILGG